MRAYLLGYNHGKNDGYYSTLIELGWREKSYDESLDVEYVAVDKMLEIIETAHFDLDDSARERDVYMRVSEYRKWMKKAVLGLKGG